MDVTRIHSRDAVGPFCYHSVVGAFLLLVAGVIQSTAHSHVASTATTSLLATTCNESRANLAADFCSGYVLATFDLLSAKGIVCPSDSVTTEQTMVVARRFLSSHPELWDRTPSWVIERALREAYPCGGK